MIEEVTTVTWDHLHWYIKNNPNLYFYSKEARKVLKTFMKKVEMLGLLNPTKDSGKKGKAKV
jgi:hypothetical protein